MEAHVQATAGVYIGAGSANMIDNMDDLEFWLGRSMNFITCNLGMGGDEPNDFKEARQNSFGLFASEGSFTEVYPDKVMCVAMPLCTYPDTGLNVETRKALLQRVTDGVCDDQFEIIFDRFSAANNLVIVRLAPESDIAFNPWSLRGVEAEWTRAWNHVALMCNRYGLPCVDLNWNGSGTQRWDYVFPNDSLYSNFGGNFYVGKSGNTGYGSANEVLARIITTQAEAAERGKAFTIGEWGIWGNRGISQSEALAFVEALFGLLATFPERGPGMLLYHNQFYSKKDTSINNFPIAAQLWRDLLTR